jgi:hypothetical protein
MSRVTAGPIRHLVRRGLADKYKTIKLFLEDVPTEEAPSNATLSKKFNAFISTPEIENYEAGLYTIV